MYRQAWAHADETIQARDLDAPGHVPWWPSGRSEVTLHQVLVHVVAETNRHAGHADIVRELIDGTAGLQADDDNLRATDETWWPGCSASRRAQFRLIWGAPSPRCART